MSNKIYNQNDTAKVAVIIGGSAGIGQSAAIEIAKQGIGVILTYNSHKDGADKTVAEIESLGGKAVALPLDIGKSETFDSFRNSVVLELREKWNKSTFNYLVNNAGFGQMAMFEDTTEELFDLFIRVILKGPYFITQILLPILEDGGAIVNTTSNSALPIGLTEGYSAYATAKGGLTVLTRCMAKEFSKRNIRVNSIAPGPTRTRIANDAFEMYPEIIPAIAAKTALGRVGEAEDLGRIIASLLSNEWAWVTGENIEASGGYNM